MIGTVLVLCTCYINTYNDPLMCILLFLSVTHEEMKADGGQVASKSLSQEMVELGFEHRHSCSSVHVLSH